MNLARLYPVAILCETLNEIGDALKGEELSAFANTFKIKIISIEDLINYRLLLSKTI